jgi:hypothetical protein
MSIGTVIAYQRNKLDVITANGSRFIRSGWTPDIGDVVDTVGHFLRKSERPSITLRDAKYMVHSISYTTSNGAINFDGESVEFVDQGGRKAASDSIIRESQSVIIVGNGFAEAIIRSAISPPVEMIGVVGNEALGNALIRVRDHMFSSARNDPDRERIRNVIINFMY